MNPIRVAILASGRGSNAVALIEKAKTLRSYVEVCFVLSDKAGAGVLEKAQALGVPTYVVAKTSDKTQHEQAILEKIREHKVDWILLAGYMRLLSADFLKKFSNWVGQASQIVNVHPSLLPHYPGVDPIGRAYRDRVAQSGVTIHLVDEGMDTGRILLQESLLLNFQEELSHFEERIHQLEHRLYTRFLQEIGEGVRPTRRFHLDQ